MAKKIIDTPSLEGKEAYDFLKKMEEPPTEEDLKIAKDLASLKRVVPFPD
ncbi:MAG: hypothetical protein LBU40_05980 [Methanobrevibacter sp.]|jgi:hypothetical protein|nr:hypothetical protein [Methanobrevibacter sp.]